jgi:hypothetical protein
MIVHASSAVSLIRFEIWLKLIAEPLLEESAARATGKGITDFLALAPNAEPPESDRLPEGCRRKQ